MQPRTLTRFLFAIGFATLAASVITLRPGHRAPASVPSSPDPQRAPATKQESIDPAQDPCHHLYQVVCSKQGITRDPTGYVRPDIEGELITLRQYEEIVHNHPDWASEQVDEALAEQIYTPAHRNRLEAAFRWVKHAIEQFLNSQPDSVLNAREKKRLISRIHHAELQLPPPISLYSDEPELLTKNDVFYERMADGKVRLRVGGAYFVTSRSWFNMIFTLGHELGHSIDPCEIRSQRWSFPAYDRLAACFMKTKLVALRKNRFECGPNDQLSETFADWLAAQVTAEALKSFATEFHGQLLLSAVTNSVRDLCAQEDDDDDDDELDVEFHPTPETRIEKIFGSNPVLREVLGCPAEPKADATTRSIAGTTEKTPPSEPTDCRFDSKIGDSM